MMSMLRWPLVAALFLLTAPAAVHAKDHEEAPDAVHVVVRGKQALADALAVGFEPLSATPEDPPEAVLVLDATPGMRKAAPRIRAALEAFGPRAPKAEAWRLARLGGKPGKERDSAGALAGDVPEALEDLTETTSTIDALARTLKRVRGKGAVVVYVAETHFEDDCDLERLIKSLRRKDMVFSAIGPEAAFGRGWNDGFKDIEEQIDDLKGFSDYRDDVGRSPFGRKKHDAPWYGGETSHPTRPWHWAWSFWETEFTPTDFDLMDGDDLLGPDIDLPDGLDWPEGFERPGSGSFGLKRLQKGHRQLEELAGQCPEALAKRLAAALAADRKRLEAERAEAEKRREAAKEAREGGAPTPGAGVPDEPPEMPPSPFGPNGGLDITMREVPLPSAFGPYGLMRAAGMTGGRYVLFSFATGGQKTVEYDYGRCNLFPPDLRARDEIRRDLDDDPHAAALLAAWHRLVEARGSILRVSPPLDPRGRPETIEYLYDGPNLSFIWDTKHEYDAFRDAVEEAREAVTEALAPLDAALASDAPPAAGVARRYQADALLVRHALRKLAFELDEALAALPELTRKDWKRGKRPGLLGLDWIEPGRAPHRIPLDVSRVPADAEAGVRLYLERRALLERLRGTPWGEQLALNGVELHRPNWWEEIDHAKFRDDRKRSRSKDKEGEPETPSAPGRGASGGGGAPTTGR